MKKLIFLAVLLPFGSMVLGQDFVDNALLFSRTGPAGSARILGVGGAQVALGGDFSSALSNPAGLGMYNRSEFTITPGLSFQNNSSTYFGAKTTEQKDVFHLPGLSLVLHHETDRESGFLGGSFAVTMSRINNLNRDFRYSADNNQNSMIDYFLLDADGLTPESMLWPDDEPPGANFFTLTALAYNNYLMEDVPAGSTSYRSVLSPLDEEVRTVRQEEINEARGAQTQWSISYGANFDDKVFLGAGLGLISLRFEPRQFFTESNFRFSLDPGYQPLDFFQTDESYDITGSGVNFSLGAVYRPINFLQVGASFVSPTYYSIIDYYTARIDSYWFHFDDPDFPNSFPSQPEVYEEFGEPLISEYRITTPLKFNTGIAFISKYGFITTDVEFVNYGRARYRAVERGDSFTGENDAIKGEYKNVINYKVGAEFRYDLYRLRAGFNYMADPYRVHTDIDRSIKTFTAGAGIRTRSFFADLAAMLSSFDQTRLPYFVDGPDPVAFQTFKTTTLLLTLGFTF